MWGSPGSLQALTGSHSQSLPWWLRLLDAEKSFLSARFIYILTDKVLVSVSLFYATMSVQINSKLSCALLTKGHILIWWLTLDALQQRPWLLMCCCLQENISISLGYKNYSIDLCLWVLTLLHLQPYLHPSFFFFFLLAPCSCTEFSTY